MEGQSSNLNRQLCGRSLNLCRFFCRIHHVHHVGLDDYCIAAALCVAIALAIMNILHIQYGTGLHFYDLPLEDPTAALIPTLKHWYAYQIIYPLALLFVKLSFLALYWRIFGQTPSMRWSILVVGGVVVTYTITVMFVNVRPQQHKDAGVWLTRTGIRVRRQCVAIVASDFSPGVLESTSGLL